MAGAPRSPLGTPHFLGLLLTLTCGQDVWGADHCTVQVRQLARMTVEENVRSATIHCDINPTNCSGDRQFFWFLFLEASHRELSIQGPKYTLAESSLIISPVLRNDSGIYYCAVAFKESSSYASRGTGDGTVLVVRDSFYIAHPKGKALLCTILVLLALYSVAISILLIRKKTCQRRWTHRRSRDDTSGKRKGGSTRRKHFGAVVQELYGRKNPRRNAKTTTKTHSPSSKLEEPPSPSAADDIYQNM
ncbi:immunoglobulin superfamily member 6 [Amia ocellicauda]|uniref:immunoglobulin superfamily member 6 n=1 Tax=Amia ocellicauda TaxID=2972642 RepID=UPI0034646B45